jgi:hypothetical protein
MRIAQHILLLLICVAPPVCAQSDVMFTQGFRVPETLLVETLNDSNKSGGFIPLTGDLPIIPDEQVLEDYFSKTGVTWPEGSCIHFDRSRQELLIRNTISNLQIIASARNVVDCRFIQYKLV